MSYEMKYGHSLLTPDDIYLFNEGNHFQLYDKLGARPVEVEGVSGVHFAVWAPSASKVSLIGDFNNWTPGSHPLKPVGSSGIWEGFCAGLGRGSLYKYHIQSTQRRYEVAKTDPFAFHCETPPRTSSIVWDIGYTWNDDVWMSGRGARHALTSPLAIY